MQGELKHCLMSQSEPLLIPNYYIFFLTLRDLTMLLSMISKPLLIKGKETVFLGLYPLLQCT